MRRCASCVLLGVQALPSGSAAEGAGSYEVEASGTMVATADQRLGLTALSNLLPEDVVVVETRRGLVRTELSEAEQRRIASALPKRRDEFTTGRACARLALERLGAPRAEVPSGSAGEPLWPPDVVGSITHCETYRACAVAWKTSIDSIGIDAEENEPLPDGVLDRISSAAERSLMPGGKADACLDRVLFSAKEAVYKAWYPLSHEWLGFHDVHLELDVDAHGFVAELRIPGPLVRGRTVTEFRGRWGVDAGTVITAVTVQP